MGGPKQVYGQILRDAHFTFLKSSSSIKRGLTQVALSAIIQAFSRVIGTHRMLGLLLLIAKDIYYPNCPKGLSLCLSQDIPDLTMPFLPLP